MSQRLPLPARSPLARVLAPSALVALTAGLAQADKDVEVFGSFHDCLAPNNDQDYDITNRTNEPIFAFVVTVETPERTPLDRLIRRLRDPGGFDPDFNVDDNLNGVLEDNENNSGSSDVDPPATTARTQAEDDDEPVPPDNGNDFDLDIDLTGTTTGDWCVHMQPTDLTGKAIGCGVRPSFDGANAYYVELSSEAAETAPFTGLAFNDVNATGAPLSEFRLTTTGFTILDAYQKDEDGFEIPGSSFHPISRTLTLAEPTNDGQRFYFAIEVDTFLGAERMEVRACSTLASATVRNAGNNPLSYTAPVPPIVGASFVGVVDLTTTGHTAAVLVSYATPMTFTLANGYAVLVNVFDPGEELIGSPLRYGPVSTFTVPIPDELALCGMTVSSQAIHLGGMPGIALSNALDFVLGRL